MDLSDQKESFWSCCRPERGHRSWREKSTKHEKTKDGKKHLTLYSRVNIATNPLSPSIASIRSSDRFRQGK